MFNATPRNFESLKNHEDKINFVRKLVLSDDSQEYFAINLNIWNSLSFKDKKMALLFVYNENPWQELFSFQHAIQMSMIKYLFKRLLNNLIEDEINEVFNSSDHHGRVSFWEPIASSIYVSIELQDLFAKILRVTRRSGISDINILNEAMNFIIIAANSLNHEYIINILDLSSNLNEVDNVLNRMTESFKIISEHENSTKTLAISHINLWLSDHDKHDKLIQTTVSDASLDKVSKSPKRNHVARPFG